MTKKTIKEIITFAKYLGTSLTAALVDLILFTIFCKVFAKIDAGMYIMISTYLARFFSATLNYFLDKFIVFKSDVSKRKSGVKFAILTIIQVTISGMLVQKIHKSFPDSSETGWKCLVDTTLFFVFYFIQKVFVFEKKETKNFKEWVIKLKIKKNKNKEAKND